MKFTEDQINSQIGKVYGVLTLISFSHSKLGLWYNCICECGNEKVLCLSPLRRGKVKSCGCLLKKALDIRWAKMKIHGESKTRLHHIWTAMRDRCLYTKHNNYHNYGGRGIKICSEWNSFVTFRDWAHSHGYTENLTIERKNVNGNYEPSNCTWIPKSDQINNRRVTIRLSCNGENLTIPQWGRKLGISSETIYFRYYRGYSTENCLRIDKFSSHFNRTYKKNINN